MKFNFGPFMGGTKGKVAVVVHRMQHDLVTESEGHHPGLGVVVGQEVNHML